MPKPLLNITNLVRGEPFKQVFQIRNDEGQPKDLQGASFEGVVSPPNSIEFLRKTDGLEPLQFKITCDDAVVGKLILSLSAKQTLEIENHSFYQIKSFH